MTPHTLEEQKELLTAEAEGKVVRGVCPNGERFIKNPGAWSFDCCRYEVERPLMECWANEYADGFGGLYTTEKDAKDAADIRATRIAVHLREVR